MSRLEEVVAKMESGEMPLDQLITAYEEGVKLVKMCQQKLDAAEQKIQVITKNAAGPDGLKDFPTTKEDDG